MKKLEKIFISLVIVVPMVLLTSSTYAATLSASKTLTTTKYSGAYMDTTATVSCPNTGTFSWTSRTASNNNHATLQYTFYNSGSTWSGSNTSKTTVYNWKWYALKLPENASGTSTSAGSGSGKATFKYDSSTKNLSVQ